METAQENNYMINDLKSKRTEHFAGIVVSHTQDKNKFIFTCDNDIMLMIHILTDKLIRFRFATDGRFPNDFSYAVETQPDTQPEELEFVEMEDHFRFTTKQVILTLTKEGLISKIMDKSGNILCEDEKGFHYEENREFGGDIVIMSKKVHGGEHYFGLGDKSWDLDLRGERFELWGADTYGYGKKSDPLYKNIPFYVSLHKKIAYGIFFDNSFRSFFDFGHERSNVSSFFAQGGEMNYYFFYGPEMLSIVEDYTLLTGTPELPPLWALGYHQCKWSYYPENVVRGITDGFRKRQIPCDAIYLDIDYMEGFRCFTWNKKYFPNPAKMVKELAEEGFKTIVIIDPGIKIDPNYSVYTEALEKNYFCQRADGPLMKGSVWPGLCNFPDFTNPEVRDWWRDLFKGLIQEDGIKGVWNDMNEPAVFEEGTFPLDVRHDYDGNPCSHRKGHNVYGMQMSRATYEGVKKFSYPNRPFTITRSGYSGLQRFASVWTGDNVASWEHLKLANIQCQRLATSGISFAGSDIGGFIETPSGELFTRWIQLGIFHPFCRVHSSGDHGEQEPWSFGDEYTDIVRKFIEFRYRILPYIYTSFWQYANAGTPMLRQIQAIGQNDPETYYRMEEFGVGDSLVVCPITQDKADGRWMYLPEGEWYYFWTDECVLGEQEVWADADLSRIPLYVKAGSVFPMYPIMQYVGEKVIEELILHIYYKKGTETSTLYEDKGDGYDYAEGQCNVKNFTVSGEEDKLQILQTIDGQYTPTYSNCKLYFHGFPTEFSKLTVDKKKFEITEDVVDGNKVLTALVPTAFSHLEIR